MASRTRLERIQSFARLFGETIFVSAVMHRDDDLASYGDESGTHDAAGNQRGAEVAIVAAYVSYKKDWDLFCAGWQSVLDRYGISEFHMQEFAKEPDGRPNDSTQDPSWPYYGWSRKKKDDFIRELVPVARDNSYFGIAGAVDVRAYDRVVPAWLKGQTKHPYYFCFQMFFDLILDTLRNKLEVPLLPGEQVAFFLISSWSSKTLRNSYLTRLRGCETPKIAWAR